TPAGDRPAGTTGGRDRARACAPLGGSADGEAHRQRPYVIHPVVGLERSGVLALAYRRRRLHLAVVRHVVADGRRAVGVVHVELDPLDRVVVFGRHAERRGAADLRAVTGAHPVQDGHGRVGRIDLVVARERTGVRAACPSDGEGERIVAVGRGR